MPVRNIKQEELLECKKIQSIAFVYSMDTAKTEQEITEGTYANNHLMGYFNDKNVLTACMELPEYQARYEDSWVKMVGIGGVASLPEYRFGGAIRQIFLEAFRQMRESGTVFSSLYPFSHKYYRKFGYELCQSSTGYEVPVEALSKFRYEGKVRMVQSDDSMEALKTIFNAHFLRYHLAIQRQEQDWKNLLGKDCYKDRVYTYLLEDEAGPSAYVVLAAKDAENFEKKAYVRELAFVRPQGLQDLFGLLYRLSAQYSKACLTLPEDIPLAALLDDPYGMNIRYENLQMTRVINVQKALELKAHFEGAAYTLRVQDEVIPENDGVFSLCCKDGIVTAEKLPDADSADLTVDVRTLAQLLLGYLSIDEAVYKKDVQVHANLETLRRIFIKKPVFLTEHF